MKRLLNNPWFWLGVFVRVILIPHWGSHYLKEFFIPFLDDAVRNPGSNPWETHSPEFFPYGSVLYLILFVPRYIAFSIFGEGILGAGVWGMALIKLPLVVADFLLLLALAKFAPYREKALVYFYWLNPVVIFISYLYGQLDVVSMSLFLWALVFLTRSQLILSAAVFGAAALCKSHVVAFVPVVLAYFWINNFRALAWKKMMTWIGVFSLVLVAGALPLFVAQRFLYATVSSPEALQIFGITIQMGLRYSLYVGILSLLVLLGRICLSSYISNLGLVLCSGLLFGGLLLITGPMPGWYLWVLPAFTLFVVTYWIFPKILFAGWAIIYVVNYGIIFNDRWVDSPMVRNLSFTVLQACTLGLMIAIARIILRREIPLMRRDRPLAIGISGDSGAGKNYLVDRLVPIFGANNCTVVEGDNYHRWERGHGAWKEFTHLSPLANNLIQWSEHVRALTTGRLVRSQIYQHDSGKFSDLEEIAPNKTLFFQGLHTFYLKTVREVLDLKIFIQPETQLRKAWKINRDVGERGHSEEKILQSLETRKNDSDQYVLPQRAFADWILEYFWEADQKKIYSQHTVWNDFPLMDFIEATKNIKGLSIVARRSDDLDRISFSVHGSADQQAIDDLARQLFPKLRALTRSKKMPVWNASLDGIHQVIFILLLQTREDSRDLC